MSVDRGSEFKPELYDEIAPGYYDEVYARGRGVQWFWHHHRFAAVAQLLPSAGDSILDMGCGPGTFLGHYSSGFRRAVGTDLARPQIEFARKRYGSERVRFENSDVAAFAQGEQFDAITSIEVIEHLPAGETQSFLRSIHGHLKPGGTLVLTTPNYRSFWPLVERLISRVGPVDYTVQHINRFHTGRLVRELEAAGFVVRKARTFFVVAPFLAALSTKLADVVYRIEQKLLPWLGSEIVVSAEKPRR